MPSYPDIDYVHNQLVSAWPRGIFAEDPYAWGKFVGTCLGIFYGLRYAKPVYTDEINELMADVLDLADLAVYIQFNCNQQETENGKTA